jgi:Protein of unknown function (DUF2961)
LLLTLAEEFLSSVMLKSKSLLVAGAAMLLFTACSSHCPMMGTASYPAFSTLGSLPEPHPGTAMHEGSWDRTGGNRDCLTVQPGQTVTLLDQDGAGIVHRFWMTIGPRNVNTLRQAILRMYWDNETNPSVECPLGDFFGLPFGKTADYISAPLEVTSGGCNCYWPMPFHKHARWTLENRSGEQIHSFYYNIDYTAYASLPKDMMEFHACWRRENPTSPDHNYTILEAQGDGVYSGVMLYMQGLNMGKNKLAFLEGDEMMYIDQPNPCPPTPANWHHPEAVPQINGTGTEDFFSSGWYFDTGPYSAPYHGCILKDDKNSRVAAYRWEIEEAVPFHKNIRVTIEHGDRDKVEADYTSVAFFYQNGPHEAYPPLPANAEDLLPSKQ